MGNLATVDLIIIFGFTVVVTVIGIVLSKVAAKGIEDYFLGGNKIPGGCWGSQRRPRTPT